MNHKLSPENRLFDHGQFSTDVDNEKVWNLTHSKLILNSQNAVFQNIKIQPLWSVNEFKSDLARIMSNAISMRVADAKTMTVLSRAQVEGGS